MNQNTPMLPKHGGPNSFDEAWQGLRKRKGTIKRRNQQIKDLKAEIKNLREINLRYFRREKVNDVLLDATKEALKMTVELSRTMDNDHWYRSDLWNLVSVLENAIAHAEDKP